MPIAPIASQLLLPVLQCRRTPEIWRSLEYAALAAGVPVTAWPAWRIQDADGPQSDLLEFALRRGKPFAFAALVDLGFHFHWPLLPREHLDALKASFENAIAHADTIFMLDVAPADEAPELKRERLARREEVSKCLTEAVVVFLRRAPEASRSDELSHFGRVTLLDNETMAAVKKAHETAAIVKVQEELARSMAPIEERARQASNRL